LSCGHDIRSHPLGSRSHLVVCDVGMTHQMWWFSPKMTARETFTPVLSHCRVNTTRLSTANPATVIIGCPQHCRVNTTLAEPLDAIVGA